jgi:arginase family enzyme
MTRSSDIALTICQSGAGDRNTRAMIGARLLGEALAARIGVKPTMLGQVTAPVGGTWHQELAAARPNLRVLAETLESAFSAQRTPFTTLSRCAVALATLPVVAKRRPDACVVWFDAHGDINTPETTKSGYLGGMVITGAAGRWDTGLGAELDLANVVLVGSRDLDPAERTLIEAGTPRLVSMGPNLAERLGAAIAERPIYIHLDCDVMEPGLVPTEFRVPGGLMWDDFHAACSVIARNEVVGLEIAEFEATPGPSADETSITALVHALQPLVGAVTRSARIADAPGTL